MTHSSTILILRKSSKMSHKIYILHDSKSETYAAPTVHPARGQALRSFGDAVNKGQGPLKEHPGDFTLLEVGDFDPRTGVITLYEGRVSVANGLDVQVSEQV